MNVNCSFGCFVTNATGVGLDVWVFYKERSILVQKIPKIATRCRFSARIVKLEFRIFCEKSRQNERSSALCSLDVNKVSRNFFKKSSGK